MDNQPTAALDSLRSAFEKGIQPEKAEIDPDFDALRGTPEFAKLVEEFWGKRISRGLVSAPE